MKTRIVIGAVVLATLALFAYLWIPRPEKLERAGGEEERFERSKESGHKRDTSFKPSEWFTISRAYPYSNIPFEAYKSAVAKAKELHNQTASLAVGTWTMSGPTNVGGRVTAMALDPTNPDIVYGGAALGGVFKSTNSGLTWLPISDAVPSLSVGDIALDPNDPNKLYFGTGEANSSGDSYEGTGVYRTTDAGTTWEFLGLPESRHIGRIAIDRTNSNRIFVAATGTLFGTNPERGIYRTTDAGATWERVLFVSDSTSGIDVAINPTNPNIVYAAMWERIRSPIYRRVGGLTSGIWKSTDGGDTWNQLTSGLPGSAPDIGRIGLAIAPGNPNIVYASYSDNPGNLIGFWRTTNGGTTWTSRLVSPSAGSFSGFGWYFGRIWVNPTNADQVYFGDVYMWKSTDGAAHWSDITGIMHVDQHAWVQDPANPNLVFCGNDGGIFKSLDGGSLWTKCYDLPITQFYAITIDSHTPQRLYGGTQDNSTPRTLTGAPDNWDVIFGGDGFYAAIDFTNSNIVYSESQYGYLAKSTNLGGSWNIILDGIDGTERVNWCTPVVMSPFNSQILFYGAQRLYKTVNGGGMWNHVSLDLTGGPGGGNLVFGTITTISQSPLSPNIIWVGTDDSRVWITRNGGANWSNVSSALPDRWCTRVTADVFDSSTAYVTFSGYHEGDLMPHIFKTTNRGVNWSDISGNLAGIPINDVLPDPAHPGRLYVGTDFGVYYTQNGGELWRVLGDNHPICPVFDIDLHNGTRKLVSGTHGRSMYTYDLNQLEGPPCNITPGDANGSRQYNGVDIVFGVNYLKGIGEIPPDSCDCGTRGWVRAAADANGDCVFNGLDITYGVIFFKGFGSPPQVCPDCP